MKYRERDDVTCEACGHPWRDHTKRGLREGDDPLVRCRGLNLRLGPGPCRCVAWIHVGPEPDPQIAEIADDESGAVFRYAIYKLLTDQAREVRGLRREQELLGCATIMALALLNVLAAMAINWLVFIGRKP